MRTVNVSEELSVGVLIVKPLKVTGFEKACSANSTLVLLYNAILFMAGAPELNGPALLICVEKSSVMEEILVAEPSESFDTPSPSVKVKPAIATLVAVF